MEKVLLTRYILKSRNDKFLNEVEKSAKKVYDKLSKNNTNAARAYRPYDASRDGFVVADAFRIIYRGPVTSVEEEIIAVCFFLLNFCQTFFCVLHIVLRDINYYFRILC